MPVVKRSLTLRGHRTSISLESEFWDAFCTLARRRGMSVNALAAQIDAARLERGDNLSSAIRLHVLAELQGRLAASDP